MNSLAAYADLRALGIPVLETGDAATRLKTTSRNAHRLLRDAEKAGLVAHARHGLWLLDPGVDSQVLLPYLTAPYPSYISLWSALAKHGMIEQIPRKVYAISLGRTREVETSRGQFSIHHVIPELFGGFEEVAPGRLVATPEKSLFDSVYIRAVQGAHFTPPELTLPEGFDAALVEEWICKVSTQRLRTLVSEGVKTTLGRGRP